MMSRKIVFTSPENSSKRSTDVAIDWKICAICQKDTAEKLECPSTFKRKGYNSSETYTKIATNILKFQEIGCVPEGFNNTLLNDNDLLTSLSENCACFHKTCKNKFSDLKLDRASKRSAASTPTIPEKITRRSIQSTPTDTKSVCFFCNVHKDGGLHKVTTYRLDRRVRKCALILQDTLILAKLSEGDMIALDAFYHKHCLTNFYRKASSAIEKCEYHDSDRESHGVALAELVTFIEESALNSEDGLTIFKLSELTTRYTKRLQDLGVEITGRIHSTRLKNRILSQFEDLKSYNEGRDVYLAFDSDIGSALRVATNLDYDDEAVILSKAANIIRRDIFSDRTQTEFTGEFSEGCQQEYVPSSLKTLVGMILGGSNISNVTNNKSFIQAQLSISQLVIFNSNIRQRATSTSAFHSKYREPPLSIYLGCLIHARTRKRFLIDKLYELGLSPSYNRVLEISTDLANSVGAQYEKDDVVCPPSLNKHLFTTAAVDNIDHNPSATTCLSSFHGTGISLFQNVGLDNIGIPRNIPLLHRTEKSSTLRSLPDEYTNIPPAYLPKEIVIPKTVVPGKDIMINKK